jgi:dTDP-D-glucose 4,6-dehydratase
MTNNDKALSFSQRNKELLSNLHRVLTFRKLDSGQKLLNMMMDHADHDQEYALRFQGYIDSECSTKKLKQITQGFREFFPNYLELENAWSSIDSAAISCAVRRQTDGVAKEA